MKGEPVAASHWCIKAVESDADGLTKLTDLAWHHVNQGLGANHQVDAYYFPLLTLYGVTLMSLDPETCVGRFAMAQTFIFREEAEKVEPLLREADQLITDLPWPLQVVGFSICIHRLLRRYEQLLDNLYSWGPTVSGDALRPSMEDTIRAMQESGRYAGVVLQRIEAADREIKLPPETWRWYQKICREWPKLREHPTLADQRLLSL
jgi:hypothetical protein